MRKDLDRGSYILTGRVFLLVLAEAKLENGLTPW